MHQCKHRAIASQVGLSDFCRFANIIYIYIHTHTDLVYSSRINKSIAATVNPCFDCVCGQSLLIFSPNHPLVVLIILLQTSQLLTI